MTPSAIDHSVDPSPPRRGCLMVLWDSFQNGTGYIILAMFICLTGLAQTFTFSGSGDLSNLEIKGLIGRAFGTMTMLAIGILNRIISMREASGKPPMQSLTETKPGEPLPFGEQLRRLEQLHAEGFITEDEFTAIRKRIIDSFGTTA